MKRIKIFLEGKGESVLIWQAERQNGGIADE